MPISPQHAIAPLGQVVAYHRKPLDTILSMKLSCTSRVLLGDPAMEVLFTDMWLAVVCHRHAQEPLFLYWAGRQGHNGRSDQLDLSREQSKS